MSLQYKNQSVNVVSCEKHKMHQCIVLAEESFNNKQRVQVDIKVLYSIYQVS